MQKFGTGDGNVEQDPQDPQGVPVEDGISREGSAMTPEDAERRRQELDAENTRVDAEQPGPAGSTEA